MYVLGLAGRGQIIIACDTEPAKHIEDVPGALLVDGQIAIGFSGHRVRFVAVVCGDRARRNGPRTGKVMA